MYMADARQRAEWSRTSLACALLANCHSAKKKFKPDDFSPYKQKPEVIYDQKLAMKALKAFTEKGGKNVKHIVDSVK